MSATVTGKLWFLQNERAIESLAKHPTWAVGTIGKLYHMPADELQAWLDAYNGGKRDLQPGRILEVKRELGVLSESRGGEPASHSAPNASPPPKLAVAAAKTSAKVTGDVWLQRPRRPKAFAVQNYRKRLDAMARGEPRAGAEGSWTKFLGNWFGKQDPGRDEVERFLAWFDGESTPAAAPIAPPRQLAKNAKLTGDACPPVRADPPPISRASSDGWTEAVLVGRNSVSYDIRWSGTGTRAPLLVFAPALVQRFPELLSKGAQIRVFLNSDRTQLGLRADKVAGVKLRKFSRTLGVRNLGLAKLLGAKALVGHEAAAVANFDLVFHLKGCVS